MTDQLEKFIRNNRTEFDIEVPNPAIWNAIEQDLNRKRSKPWIRIVSIAASVCILIVAAFIMGNYSAKNDINKAHFADETQYNEFKEAEQFYVNQIDEKLTEVRKLNPDEDVLNDLIQLDEVYNELKQEIIQSNFENNDNLIGLMIQNYKTKIESL